MPLTRAGGAVSPDNGRRNDQNSRIRSTWGLLAIGEVQTSSHRKNSASLSKLRCRVYRAIGLVEICPLFRGDNQERNICLRPHRHNLWSCDVSNYPELASWKLAIANSGIVDIK